MKRIKKKSGLFLLTLLIIMTISIIIVRVINKQITPIVMKYSTSEMKRIVSVIINRSVNSDILNKEDMDNLFIISKSNNGEISSITLDSIIVNKITDNISDACEDNLRLIEEEKYSEIKKKFNIGEEYFFVPSGIIFNNNLLNRLGPKIPIAMKMIGNVTSGIKTDVKEYGINNSLITISVEITVEIMVILPFSSDYISISNDVPFVIKLIQGKVPQLYSGNLIN